MYCSTSQPIVKFHVNSLSFMVEIMKGSSPMRKKSGPINKRVDFLSNRLNKYSIRKFTIGTASILVGSTLIFGIGSG